MGLDINVVATFSESTDPESYSFCKSEDFPFHAPNLDAGQRYAGEVVLDFCCGSYVGYNFRRDEFCQQVHGVSAESFWATGDQEMCFYYLVNFSDCDGVISGPPLLRLRDDFESYDPSNLTGDAKWYFENFKKAVETAAPDGAIIFA